jgi:hypothetical protein
VNSAAGAVGMVVGQIAKIKVLCNHWSWFPCIIWIVHIWCYGVWLTNILSVHTKLQDFYKGCLTLVFKSEIFISQILILVMIFWSVSLLIL